MKKYLKSTELTNILSCSLETLRDWRRKERLPCVKAGREYKYEIKVILEWLQKTQKNDYADLLYDFVAKSKPKPRAKNKKSQKISGAKNKKNSKTAKAVKPAKVAKKAKATKSPKKSSVKKLRSLKKLNMTESEIYANSGDLFGMRLITAHIFAERTIEVMNATDPILANRAQTILTQLADSFRKLELACLEIDERCGKVVPLDRVISYVGKISTAVKTEALSIPGALCEKIAAESDSKETYKILDDAIRSMLRHFAKEFKK